MQKLRVKRVKLRIEMDKTQGQISENSGSKLKNSGFGISPNLVKFSRTAQKKSLALTHFSPLKKSVAINPENFI